MKYAQILNGKVHWIFEDDLTLEQLGQQKYNLEQITLVDITDNADVQEDYDYDGTSFTAPTKTLVEVQAAAISELKSFLTKTDYQAIKFLEGELTVDKYASTKTLRETWRVAINTIQAATTVEEVEAVTYERYVEEG